MALSYLLLEGRTYHEIAKNELSDTIRIASDAQQHTLLVEYSKCTSSVWRPSLHLPYCEGMKFLAGNAAYYEACEAQRKHLVPLNKAVRYGQF